LVAADCEGPPGPKQFAAQQLRDSFYKKLAPNGTNPDADANALKKFLDVNDRVKTAFESVPPEYVELVNTFELILERVTSVYQDDLCLDLDFLQRHIGVGPGMNVGAEDSNFYQKLFDSQLTSTSGDLIALYRAAVCGSDTWAEAEMHRFHRFGFRNVCESTLFYVPKNRGISRTAATEPTVNMAIQKAIGMFLEQCLWRHFKISLRFQPGRNQEMARLGSLIGTLCTIDLVSASDMVGLALCERFLARSGLNAWLKRARSPRCRLPDGTLVELNMMSTMGNGYTFPLQTIIFASAVKAVYSVEGLPFDSERLNYGVFGDDIVCVKSAYEKVVWLLTYLGFEVNDAKSFSSGPFRESCGHDYFLGRQVRGVYIKTLESTPSIYSALNRLNRWSASQGIQLPRTCEWLRSCLPAKRVHYVPFSESDDAGYKVPLRALPKVSMENGIYRYKALLPRGVKKAVPIDRQGSDAIGYRDFNEFGWGVTFLGGYATTVWPHRHLTEGSMEGVIPLHHIEPALAFVGQRSIQDDTIGLDPDLLKPYKSRGRLIPWWDQFTWVDSRFKPASYETWKTLVTLQTLTTSEVA
jgi:hypothetical protein